MRVPSLGCSRAPPRLRTTTNVSGPRPSGGGGVQESGFDRPEPVRQATWVSPVECVSTRPGPRAGRPQWPGSAGKGIWQQQSRFSRGFAPSPPEPLRGASLWTTRTTPPKDPETRDRPAGSTLRWPPGRLPAGPRPRGLISKLHSGNRGLPLSDLGHAIASDRQVRREFLHAIKVLEGLLEVEVAKGVLGCLKMPHERLTKHLPESAAAPALVNPEIALANRALPLQRGSAVPASRRAGLPRPGSSRSLLCNAGIATG